MAAKSLVIAFAIALSAQFACGGGNASSHCGKHCDNCCQASKAADTVTVGAALTDEYIPLLKGKRVALLSNHTGMVGDRHTLDILIDNGIDVVKIFSPEHGFRGTADAGERVGSAIDERTGVAIYSLYGKTRFPDEATMRSIDVIVSDIQDVGLRFYTYYCTMIDLMNTAIKYGKRFVVLDRPNPNGMTVDGPILDMKYASGVGRLPIPVVHGLTLGEMALMANGEGWLDGGKSADLKVVKCKGYTHATRYALPIAPSPNLPTMKAVYLYPSLCYFEATPVSLGRGTNAPFTRYGHPDFRHYDFEFTPRPTAGAKNPPLNGRLCKGRDLSRLDDEEIIAKGINLEYLIDAYRQLNIGDRFFTSFFEKLIGRGDIRTMIEQGRTADEIRATWADDVARFRQQRKPYLLYDDCK